MQTQRKDMLSGLVFIILLILAVFLSFFGLVGKLIGIALFPLVFRFTFVKEGQAKAILRLNGFKKVIMVWKGYRLDQNGNVVEGEEKRLFYGFFYIGIWPIDKIYSYDFRWRSLELIDGKEQMVPHEEEIDYIFVRPDVYWTEILEVETKPPERIPINMEILVTMRTINPFLTLFRAPSNWNENVMARLNALFRGIIGLHLADEILLFQNEPLKLLEEIRRNPLNDDILKWGILIEAVEIRNVGFTAQYQEALARQREAELLTRGKIAETVGALLEAMAMSQGKTIEQIKKEIEENSELRNSIFETSRDLIIRQMGIDAGVYGDSRWSVNGAEGFLAALFANLGKGDTKRPKNLSPEAQNLLKKLKS